MRVIGVGLPRTGTRTLSAALEILGFTCVHQPAGQHQLWESLDETDFIYPADMRNCISPLCDALVECAYWRVLLDAYPEAKVVLTVRGLNSWFDSIAGHINRIHNGFNGCSELEILQADRSHERMFGSKYPIKALYSEAYHCHCLAVRQYCMSKERRLLEFDCTRGEWGSLPGFLGLTEPKATFPHRNKAPIITVEDTGQPEYSFGN